VATFNPILYSELPPAGVSPFDFAHIGARRFVNPTGSRKEPDASWRPMTRGPNGWPGLVLEVGFSEGLNELRRDAKWWLESSPAIFMPNGISKREVRQVIIFQASLSSTSLTIESWVFGPAPRITRNQGNRGGIAVRERPTTTLTTAITNGFSVTQVAGPPILSIIWEVLFDCAPGAGQGDIVMITPTLQRLANIFWAQAGP
jgi:hypothetical protein